MTKVDSALSHRIANAGFLCMIPVILNHCWAPQVPVCSPGWWLYRLLSNGYFILPFFFTVSGFFLVGHIEDPNWYRKAIAKRVYSLLLPFFLWCGFFFAERLIVECVHWETPVRVYLLSIWHKPLLYRLAAFGLAPFSHPWMGPLWFLRTLFVLVCMSPVLVWLVRRKVWLTLLITLAVYLLPLPERQDTPGYFFFTFCGLRFLFPFALGIAWRLGKIRFSLGRTTAIGLLIVGYILMLTSTLLMATGHSFSGWQLILQDVERVGHLLFAYGLLWGVTARAWPAALTGTTFPLYICHFLVLDVFSAYYYYYAQSLGGWLVRVAVGLLGTLLIVMILHRLFPRSTAVVWGGR